MAESLIYAYPTLAEATPAFLLLRDKLIDKVDVPPKTLLHAAYTAMGFGLGVFVPDKPLLILTDPQQLHLPQLELIRLCDSLEHRAGDVQTNNFGASFNWRLLLKLILAAIEAALGGQ